MLLTNFSSRPEPKGRVKWALVTAKTHAKYENMLALLSAEGSVHTLEPNDYASTGKALMP